VSRDSCHVPSDTSLRDRPEQARAQRGAAPGVDTAVVRTAPGAAAKRGVRVVEHPARDSRMSHFTPAMQPIRFATNDTCRFVRVRVCVA